MADELPAGLRRLWASEGRDEPQARPALSLRRIVQAAIELADAGGLDAVSMSRLAQRLGYTTMSLYRYVANKDELLVHMHDAAWQMPDGLDRPAEGWRGSLSTWCLGMRAALRRHPWLEGIRVTERMGTPSQLTWQDRGLRALSDTPLSEYEKSHVLLLLNGLVFWDARVVADFAQATRASGASVGDLATAYGQVLRTLADPERFPALRKAVEGGAFDAAEMTRFADLDADFMFGLNLILDGVEHMIDERRSDESP
jgi:AcrR family transcriptional regulator